MKFKNFTLLINAKLLLELKLIDQILVTNRISKKLKKQKTLAKNELNFIWKLKKRLLLYQSKLIVLEQNYKGIPLYTLLIKEVYNQISTKYPSIRKTKKLLA